MHKQKDLSPVVPLTLPFRTELGRCFALMLSLTLIMLVHSALAALTKLSDELLLLCMLLASCFILFLLFLPLCYRLELRREGIQIRFLGKPIQLFLFSKVRCICISGNERGYRLGLSICTEAELAALWEEKLSKGIFTKHEAACRKLGGSWQQSFARDYLLAPRWGLRRLHKGTDLLWLPCEISVLLYLRRNCPEAQLLDLREPGSWLFTPVKADDVPYVDPVFGWKAEIAAEGIRYRNKKGRSHLLPASRIRTLLRIDRFVTYSKTEPAYRAYLIASPLDPAQLAEKAQHKRKYCWEKRLIAGLPFRQQLLAMAYCSRRLFWQRFPDPEITPLYYTPENEQLLRQNYPQAKWVDLSDIWQERLPDIYRR